MNSEPESRKASEDDRTAAEASVQNRSRSGRWKVLVLIAAVMLAVLGLLWDRGGEPERRVDNDTASVTTLADLKAQYVSSEEQRPDFVGPQACASCHADRVEEFQQTHHFRTCRFPQDDEMPPGFREGDNLFVTRFPGLAFEMSHSDGQYMQTAVRTSSAGSVERRSHRIDLVLGAGSADDVYLSWRDDERMYELPMAWLWTHNEWAAAFFDPHGSEDFSRPLTARCLECHNTWIEHVPGSFNQYRRDGFIPGVTCERCHGPGREHVDYHEAHPDAVSAEGIVHPGGLPRERLIEVCTQCHSNAVKYRRAPFTYRPGELLEEHYKTLAITHTEDDHVANQIKYLRESRCFQESDTMTCITCHDPHEPHGENHTSGADSCSQCHHTADCGERERLPEPLRDRCIDCHMPAYVKINVNFQTADDNHVPPIRRYDHRIAVHSTARDTVLLDWYRTQSDAQSGAEADRLSQKLLEHWQSQAETHRGEFRFTAAIAALREALRIEDSPAIRDRLREVTDVQTRLDDDWADAVNLFTQNRMEDAAARIQGILEAKPDHADAHYRLGTIYATTGRMELARQHLRVVAEHDPHNGQGLAMLGWLAYLDGQPESALDYFQRADEAEPFNGKINYQIGLALAELGRIEEAAESFRKSLHIEPMRSDACEALTMALLHLGDRDAAVATAIRAAAATDYVDPRILLTLAEACAQSGLFPAATEAGAQALTAAETIAPELVPRIQARLDEWRADADEPTDLSRIHNDLESP